MPPEATELAAMREHGIEGEQRTGGVSTHTPDGLVPRALVEFVAALGTPTGEVVQVAATAAEGHSPSPLLRGTHRYC